jgi:3-isopropylmalate/(R)-2-methylmalate dehydratase small subunit
VKQSETVFEPLGRLVAKAVYLSGPNIDTDQIIPGRFLKKSRVKVEVAQEGPSQAEEQGSDQGAERGYSPYLFFDTRFDEQGVARSSHPLNAHDKPRMLLVDDNFGCGSSREGAVYALADYGIRVVIGVSFGDIFFNNCFKNGVLAIRLPVPEHQRLRQALSRPRELTVDLPAQSIGCDEIQVSFEVDAFSKTCLMQGVDELALTLSHEDDITRFERTYWQRYPWLCKS